jgi:hypothetical protein
MLFKRVLHDGLWAVINRPGKAKIVFTRGVFETKDPEQINYLLELGYHTDDAVEGKEVSYDYAIKKINEDGKLSGRAVKVCDEKSQAEDYMLENELDLDKFGIEERPRK